MMVYHRYSWKVLWILLVYGKGQFWKLDELIPRYSEAQTGCPVTYTYTKESVNELLKNSKIIKLQVEHIFPYRISDYINYNYVKTWYFRWMPDSVFKWLERRFGWHMCVEATV